MFRALLAAFAALFTLQQAHAAVPILPTPAAGESGSGPAQWCSRRASLSDSISHIDIVYSYITQAYCDILTPGSLLSRVPDNNGDGACFCLDRNAVVTEKCLTEPNVSRRRSPVLTLPTH